MLSSKDSEKEIVLKPLQVFIRHSKNMVSPLLPSDPESTALDVDPRHSASPPTVRPLSTTEMDTLAHSNLDLPIAH